MAGERILVVDDTISFARLLAAQLTAAGYNVELAASGTETLERVKTSIPDMFILDLMMPDMDGFQLTQRLRAIPSLADRPIIILTARETVQDKVRGFEAGADDYVVKPFEAPELLARIRSLLARSRTATPPPTAKPSGMVITTFGLRGGAGRSTLVTNLSIALTEIAENGVAVCDLSLESGHLSVMFDVKPMHTVDELISRYNNNFEMDVLQGFLTNTRYNVKLMAAPASPAGSSLVNEDGVRHLIQELRQQYSFVLLDLSSSFNEATLAGLEAADVILLTTTPDIAGVKSSAAALQIMDSLGYEMQRTLIVVNTVFEARPLSLKDISAALGQPVALNIPHERGAFVDAINFGVPAIIAAPRTLAVRTIVQFAHDLAQRYSQNSR